MSRKKEPRTAGKSARSEQRDTGNFGLALARLQGQRRLRKPRLQEITSMLRSGHTADAEQELKDYLVRHPDDADAVRLLAKAVNLLGRPDEAALQLARCLELAPDFAAARFHYSKLLLQLHRYNSALGEADRLLAGDADNPLFRQLKADTLRAIGEDETSLVICERLAAENAGHVESWIRYGDVLRTAGLHERCVAAYRRAIAIRPSAGLAWWSLANLKTFRFSDDDVRTMREQLQRPQIDAEDRVNLLFSLGKACEDSRQYAGSFDYYSRGNAARRVRLTYDWAAIGSLLDINWSVFTPKFLRGRSNAGCMAPDPIFIFGRPRSGSTLIEQILASHSAIEGTAELPYLADIAFRLDERGRAAGKDYPRILEDLTPTELAALGEEYLGRASMHRKLNRPFFIDKAPANYHHVGLILLILPNARIIDARRHPMASCLSMFKHNYTDTNLRLGELGHVYRDYVALTAHFDRVAPGRIHRVIYEEMVVDPETETRRLLDYLGLPFEESCLRFYETQRAVRSPSSEQVRRPITSEAVDHWRNFEPWLSPLIESLGSALTSYPCVPEELG